MFAPAGFLFFNFIQLPDGATPPPCLGWVVENCRNDTTTCLPAAPCECAFLSVCLLGCLSVYLPGLGGNVSRESWVGTCPVGLVGKS